MILDYAPNFSRNLKSKIEFNHHFQSPYHERLDMLSFSIGVRDQEKKNYRY